MINPNDSNHLIQGNDGGINITYDRGRTWDYANTVPLGQFYEIGADNSVPYKICGGLQDNNTWCGPSQTLGQSIRNDDWYTVGGGDGFYAQPDPNDPDIVYGESQDGNLFRRNVRTGENKSIRPREEEGEKRYRFQWNSPLSSRSTTATRSTTPVTSCSGHLIAATLDQDQPGSDHRRRPKHTADHGQGPRPEHTVAA